MKKSIYNRPEGWIIEYPEFSDLADQQLDTIWPWYEPSVKDDVQDLRVYMTEAEQHGVVTVLKLFTQYEMHAGDDYWSNRIMSKFKRPEIQRMASLFSAVELNSHAPFYNKVNEVLYLDTEEFYKEWKNSDVLKARMEFINKVVSDPDDLISTAGFSFIEGAVLYSSFAFLKHFQAEECGKNLITNICRGINLSVADENTHAVGSALLHRIIYKEANLKQKEAKKIKETIYKLASEVFEHENEIIHMIFEKGAISGISVKNMQDFVKHRINLMLSMLNCEPLYEENSLDGYVASWFYTNINSVQFHDVFTGNGIEYTIDWKEDKFGSVWV